LTHLPDWLKTSVKLLLTGLALYLVFQQVDIDQLQDLSQSLHWPWIAGAFFLFVWSKVATSIRLNHYFNNLGIHLSAWENWKLYLIGMFYNLFLPGGIGGDGYKVYLLHQDHKTPLKQLIKASLLDRLSGLVAILVVLAVLFLWVEVPIPCILGCTALLLYGFYTFLLAKHDLVSSGASIPNGLRVFPFIGFGN